MHSPSPILTIAGSDCSAGAGIQADLKAISALGGYALTALTSVVSETPGLVSQVRLLDAEFIADQIQVLFRAFPIRAAKTGMLGGKAQVEAVVKTWQDCAPASVPLVVDPVMVATGGGKLLQDDAIESMRRLLFPLAAVITPNMDEARVLWGRDVRTKAEMSECARDLAEAFGTAVLVKGGHLEGDEATDVLCEKGVLTWFDARRTPGVKTHGTGCTYSAAIATGLGKGLSLSDAITQAKGYIGRAIAQHFAWTGGGTSPVHALNHLQQQSS